MAAFCGKLRIFCAGAEKVHLQLTRGSAVFGGLRDVGEARSASCRRYFRVSARNCMIWEVPSPNEVQRLKDIYPSPKCLMHDLLSPLVNSRITPEPYIVFSPRSGVSGRLWRAALHLSWPSKVVVSGVHPTVSGAEENAYLLACSLYREMGLLHKQECGEIVVMNVEHVFNLLRRLHMSWNFLAPSPPQFQLITTPAEQKMPPDLTDPKGSSHGRERLGDHLWETRVQAAWPYTFDIWETGPTMHASQYAAALKTCMKLKSLGLLTRGNELEPKSLAALSKTGWLAKHDAFRPSDSEFDPDYEIYSDASAKGFGAYLLTKDDDRVRWLSNSWSEHFPEYDCSKRKAHNLKQTCGTMQLDSTFFEMYAVVAACYTWKHKFVDQRVLVWTDNKTVARFVNSGLWTARGQWRMGKLYYILNHMCNKHRIYLRAAHVRRTENTAADLLARFEVDAFREAIPEAAPACKKTKKLLFWNPLQTLPFLNEKLFQDSGETILVPSFPGQKIRSKRSSKNRNIS